MQPNVSSGSTLDELAVEINRVNVGNGFIWKRDDIPTMIALIHSEISESYEELANLGEGWETRYAEEIADVAIRTIDFGTQLGFNVMMPSGPISQIPMAVTPEHVGLSQFIVLNRMHSNTTKVLECHRGQKVNWEIAVEGYLANILIDCFYIGSMGYPIIAELVKKVVKNATRGHKHGGKLY